MIWFLSHYRILNQMLPLFRSWHQAGKYTSIDKTQRGYSRSLAMPFKVWNSYVEECRQIQRSLLRSIEPKTQEQGTLLPLSLPTFIGGKKKIKSPLKVCISSWQVHVPKTSRQSACLTMFMLALGWECNQWQLQMSSVQSCTSLWWTWRNLSIATQTLTNLSQHRMCHHHFWVLTQKELLW